VVLDARTSGLVSRTMATTEGRIEENGHHLSTGGSASNPDSPSSLGRDGRTLEDRPLVHARASGHSSIRAPGGTRPGRGESASPVRGGDRRRRGAGRAAGDGRAIRTGRRSPKEWITNSTP